MVAERIMVIFGFLVIVGSVFLAAATHVDSIGVGVLLGLGLILYAER